MTTGIQNYGKFTCRSFQEIYFISEFRKCICYIYIFNNYIYYLHGVKYYKLPKEQFVHVEFCHPYWITHFIYISINWITESNHLNKVYNKLIK